MSNFNFINHGDDPTLPPDKSKAIQDLMAKWDTLDSPTQIRILATLDQRNFVPPSIERMYSDTYYLGGTEFFNGGTVLFDFWKDSLQNKIYYPGESNPLDTRAIYLVLSGAIGIGKSTISRLCLAMTYARLLSMKNPSRCLGLAPKPLSAIIFHKSEEVARLEFKNWFKNVLEFSPFFKTTKNDALKFKLITSGPRGAGALGADTVFTLCGELNFWDNQENAQKRVSEYLIRFKSRFSTEAARKAGMFIIDSSSKGSQSCTEWFIENTDSDYTWNCHPAHWEVRPNMYKQSQGKTFKVWTGSEKVPPRILFAEEDISGDLLIDQTKIIEVPIQLMGEFKIDLLRSIQDICGIPTGGDADSFFGGTIESLIKCSTITNRIPEVIYVDFYNKQERLIDKIRPNIQLLPLKTPLWIGVDLGVAQGGDATGISAVSFEGWETINGAKIPKVKCWFSVAIKNLPNQEVSIFHIFQFILELNKLFNVKVCMDQAHSRQILQDLEREGVATVYSSTDKVPCEPAIFLKNLIMNGLIQIPFNKRLQREAYDLHYDAKGKVDHPKLKASVSTEFDNPDGTQKPSKDVWDSLAQACYALKLSCDAGEEYGTNSGYTRTMQATENIVKDARAEVQKTFQSMLENLF